MYWVIAEISEIKENFAGHCYLELIEKQSDDKNIKARVKAIIWSSRYRFLKSLFENITGETLKEGLKILVKTKIEYHEVYGLSLVITDIDPSFSIGELAVKRQQIINRLEQDGIFNMNKELTFPFLPQRIAVITSKNAAGYTDFINHLTNNSFGYSFLPTLVDAAMQGEETEHGIISALDKIAENSEKFDIVVIIRGGGSQTDLSWFDNYNIAYHVTQFPLPVLTGIGHDKDLSVTDMVAHRSLKTPTAVADFIVECVADADNHILNLSNEIADLSKIIIEKNKNRIEESRIKLIPLSRILISRNRDVLTYKIIDITNSGKRNLTRSGLTVANKQSALFSFVKTYVTVKRDLVERNAGDISSSTINLLKRNNIRLEGFESMLTVLKPENVLKRGYTITSHNGKILKSSQLINLDDIIDTQFNNGSVRSKITERKTKD